MAAEDKNFQENESEFIDKLVLLIELRQLLRVVEGLALQLLLLLAIKRVM